MDKKKAELAHHTEQVINHADLAMELAKMAGEKETTATQAKNQALEIEKISADSKHHLDELKKLSGSETEAGVYNHVIDTSLKAAWKSAAEKELADKNKLLIAAHEKQAAHYGAKASEHLKSALAAKTASEAEFHAIQAQTAASNAEHHYTHAKAIGGEEAAKGVQGEHYLASIEAAGAKQHAAKMKEHEAAQAAKETLAHEEKKAAIEHHEKSASNHSEQVIEFKHKVLNSSDLSDAEYNLKMAQWHAGQTKHHADEGAKLGDDSGAIDLKIANGNLKQAQEHVDKMKANAAKEEKKIEAPVVASSASHPHLSELIEGAKGSNEGGFYRGADGKVRYAKFYKDSTQAHGEHLANSVYRELGIDAPKSEVIQHQGKTVYVSEVIHDGKTLAQHTADAGDKSFIHGKMVSKSAAKEIMKGFAADVLLANWDAVGLSHDNVLMAGGKAHRIDNGGTLLHRAQGGRKPIDGLGKIHEWDSLTSPTVNGAYASVYKIGKPTPTQLISQIKSIGKVEKTHGSWHAFVEKTAPQLPASDKAAIASMLSQRSELLKAKGKELEAAKAKPKGPTNHGVAHADHGSPGTLHSFDFHSSSVGETINAHVESYESNHTGSRKFYDALHKSVGLSESHIQTARNTISSWTDEYRSGNTHKATFKVASALLNNGKLPEGERAEAMKAHAQVRSQKWRAFLDATGHKDTPTPTHLDVFRGVKGEDMVHAVAKAWMSDASHVNIPHDPIASWSLSKDCGNRFAGQHDSNKGTVGKIGFTSGVAMSWKAPMANTFFDQAVDNGSFIHSYKKEHEVIAGPGHNKGLPLPRENFEVFHNGKKYTYNERHELAKALGIGGH